MRLGVSAALWCALLLAGCDVGLGRSVIVVNQTSEPLTIDGDELRPHGGRWNYGFQGCSHDALDILDAAGEEYAQIDVGWCDGEVWTITGPGEVSVEEEE
ncbi:hypothetical protein IEZ26_15420 [Nocardioides cavernae]|uniref:Lipoprotein n=1 Tax=Nocardioides cavernae TaxID=1921566 RepID=A0ABR8ND00_9ACTN|nr:hypothetical protein [Nocardioides cavernae]MBD3926012.1 hypothetical protein [Nocardioides cavernae]MBM7513600.1 hypothetical protein [Nocardioides cavernae]